MDAEYGVEAAQLLSELLGDGKRIAAFIEARERTAPAAGGKQWGAAGPQKLHLTMLGAGGAAEEGANAQLLAAGLARYVAPARVQVRVTGLLLGLWHCRRISRCGILCFVVPAVLLPVLLCIAAG